MNYKFYNDKQIALIYKITALIFEETQTDINPNDIAVMSALDLAMQNVHSYETLSLYQEFLHSVFPQSTNNDSVARTQTEEDEVVN